MFVNDLMRRPNKVRAKLARGESVVGTAIYSSSPAMVSAAGYAGIDFVRIDNEHSWRRDESLENMIRAAIIADVVPIVRVDRDDPFLIRKVLEIGAGGVLIPNVVSVQDAKDLLKAAKFPPAGDRGIGPLCQSGEWGNRDRDEWIAWSNREPLVGVMIESAEALDSLDEIMALDGIDFAAFGPSDYYMSIASGTEEEKAAEIRAALLKTIAAARQAGKHVIYGVGLGDDEARSARELGITMVCVSHDVVMIRKILETRVVEFAEANKVGA